VSESLSYDVRFHSIEKRRGKRGTTYRIRWTVGGARFGETFATAKLADSYRSSLVKAAREGEPFDQSTGLPLSMTDARVERAWVEVAREFIDHKWEDFSPRHRRSTVEGLVTLTCALLRDGRAPADAKRLREALTHWEFNPRARAGASEPVREYLDSLSWIKANSVPMRALSEPEGVRRALQSLSLKLDGTKASASTVTRKRAALSGVLNYAVEKKYLTQNLMSTLRTSRKALTDVVDPRVVVNPDQAQSLLKSVMEIEPTLHAYFACLYYAALRPAEARNLRESDLTLPESGWGKLVLRGGYQEPGTAWTDDGSRGEERELKHRARNETRSVPLHPDLVAAIRRHIEVHGAGVGRRLFITRTGRGGHPIAPPYQNPVSMSTVYRVWGAARVSALTAEQCATPLGGRPYDLRHACVSTWLHAGVDSAQVAAWAGHSVAVLMRVYASCLDDREDAAKRRIEAVLTPQDTRR
jgi:integrase